MYNLLLSPFLRAICIVETTRHECTISIGDLNDNTPLPFVYQCSRTSTSPDNGPSGTAQSLQHFHYSPIHSFYVTHLILPVHVSAIHNGAICGGLYKNMSRLPLKRRILLQVLQLAGSFTKSFTMIALYSPESIMIFLVQGIVYYLIFVYMIYGSQLSHGKKYSYIIGYSQQVEHKM